MSTGSDRPRVLGGAPGGLRDRIRQKARGVAIRVLGMEFDTEERAPTTRPKVAPGEIDLSVIPKLVDGDGDTPGPNHREDIGRTWVAAQLAGGVAPTISSATRFNRARSCAEAVASGTTRARAASMPSQVEVGSSCRGNGKAPPCGAVAAACSRLFQSRSPALWAPGGEVTPWSARWW